MDESKEYFGLPIGEHVSIVFCCYQPCCRGLQGKKRKYAVIAKSRRASSVLAMSQVSLQKCFRFPVCACTPSRISQANVKLQIYKSILHTAHESRPYPPL